MGNEYANFMTKKSFHPGSYANRLKTSEAEAKAEAKRKHDEETLAQYQKEQELFHQRSLISKESKNKLSLNFMYELPPGMKKPEEQKQAENKVEWTGSGQSKPHQASTSATSSDSPGVCLEWKRDKPVSKKSQMTSNADGTNVSASNESRVAGVEHMVDQKITIKQECIKQEPIDKKPTLQKISIPKPIEIKPIKREPKEEPSDTKRIKTESHRDSDRHHRRHHHKHSEHRSSRHHSSHHSSSSRSRRSSRDRESHSRSRHVDR